ncbi:SET domain-containing protein [Bauldia sp.]|uniref:SET domain-containing protein n=1 Tax=Bauldia sp. TaxID=2575872 RepID=UPI003BA93C41
MLRVKTYIAPSPIAGIGLFAAEPIRCGELIWKRDEQFDRAYDLRDLPRDSLLRDTLLHYGYRPGSDPVYVLCGDDARFMNHADRPNADDVGDLTIACRDIAAGEEITCDYARFDAGFAERDFARSTEAA